MGLGQMKGSRLRRGFGRGETGAPLPRVSAARQRPDRHQITRGIFRSGSRDCVGDDLPFCVAPVWVSQLAALKEGKSVLRPGWGGSLVFAAGKWKMLPWPGSLQVTQAFLAGSENVPVV